MNTTKPAYYRAGSRQHIASPLQATLTALLLMLDTRRRSTRPS
jgi:hypothetical protein